MNKSITSMKLITAMFHLIAICASAQTNVVTSNLQSLQGMIEERDFLARLRVTYTPDFWVSSNDVLYLQPKDIEPEMALAAFTKATRGYTVLTNKADRTALIDKYFAASGVDENYQQMIRHPKKLSVKFVRFSSYKMMQSMENGDALIQNDEGTIRYIYGLGRAADDKEYANAELIKVGLKTYTTTIGGTKTVDAYLSVSLNNEEKEALAKLSASFSWRVSDLTHQINTVAAQQKTIIKNK